MASSQGTGYAAMTRQHEEREERKVAANTVARRRHPVDYVNLKLLAVRCEAATPVNVTVSFAS
jgi:hypothetical protein